MGSKLGMIDHTTSATSKSIGNLVLDLLCPVAARYGRGIIKNGKELIGPQQHKRKTEQGESEYNFAELTPDIIEKYIAPGNNLVLDGCAKPLILIYQVDTDGYTTATSIDLDIRDAHADQPHVFATTEAAREAAGRLIREAEQLNIRPWLECTKSGGWRVRIFHHRLQAVHAIELGKLLLQRANVHTNTEVFPKQQQASVTGSGLWLPYAGHMPAGRMVIIDGASGEILPLQTFVSEALAQRSSPEHIEIIVEEAVQRGEIPPRVHVSNATYIQPDSAPDLNEAQAADALKAMLAGCARLREIVEKAKAGQPLSYHEWTEQTMPILHSLGPFGKRYHRTLSARDPRFNEVEWERKFESFTGRPTACAKMGCSRDPHRDCGLPAHCKSPAHFAAKKLAVFHRQSDGRAEPISASEQPTAEKKQYPLTDTGNAERLVALHGKDLHYCKALGGWFVWDGTRWMQDQLGQVERKAKETVRSIYKEASGVLDDTLRKATVDHARRSESADARAAMIKLAQSEQGIPVLADVWDTDPWLLNCNNGTVDLRNGGLLPHDRHHMITRLAPVDYDPCTNSDLWDSTLARCIPDQNVRGYLQRFVGYGATGDVSEQCLLFMYGGGQNGKSTILGTIMAALGDYALQAAPDLLIAKERSGPNNDIADLKGARFVATIEVEDGKRMAESLVKQITGGDLIKARFMRKDFFTFQATHKIFLAANHMPTIRGTDNAIWRRIKFVPFTVEIPKAERNSKLLGELRNELPGVLSWIVAGCLEWLAHGLGEPDAVSCATNLYRAEMDALRPFLEESCVLSPSARVTKRELFENYLRWCEHNSERPISKVAFGARLRERENISEAARVGPNGDRGWQGIGLRVSDKLTNTDTISLITTHESLTSSFMPEAMPANVSLSASKPKRERLTA